MYTVENGMYEISCILENYFEQEKVDSIGHSVYEISLLLHEARTALDKE